MSATAPAPCRRRLKVVCPHDCPDTCVMTVDVEDGRAVAIGGDPDHRFTQGFLCAKVNRYLERVYSPERILHPLRRVGTQGRGPLRAHLVGRGARHDRRALPRGGRRARPAGDPALLLRRQHGPALATGAWTGASSTRSARACSTARSARARARPGYKATVGKSIGLRPRGDRARAAHRRLGREHRQLERPPVAVRRGGAAARRDGSSRSTRSARAPRRSPTGTSRSLPGTDAALALGMMHVIFRDGLEDRDYLERLHDRRRRAARARGASGRRSGSRRRRASGVDEVEWLAREYATTRPSAIRLNYGLNRHAGGGMAVRTIACLPAVVGAWRHAGGGVLLSTSGALPGGRGRAASGPTSSPPGHAHAQHEPARAHPDRPLARAAGEGALRLQLEPGRRRARAGEGAARASRARTCSPSSTSSSRPTPSTSPTSSCRRRRRSSTSTSTRPTATST